MAFTTGRGDITPLRGTDSFVILFEQQGWDKVDPDTGDWPSYDGRESYIDTESGTSIRPYPWLPQTSAIGITRQGTLIEGPYFKGSPIRNQAAEGPSSVAGDLAFQLSGNGTGVILRSILQDLNPVATYVQDTVTTNILASKSATTAGQDTTFVDDLTETYVPVRISITLSNSPAVDSSETETDFVIEGKNRWGETETASLIWTRAELAGANPTLTKTTQMYFDEIDEVDVDGHLSAGNYEVNYEKPVHTEVVADTASLTATGDVTLAAGASTFGTTTVQPLYVNPDSATITAGTLFAYVNIEGTDQQDRAIRNRIRYQNNTTDLARTKKTSRFFKTVTKVTVEGFSAGTFGITAVNNAQNVVITPSTDLRAYWTLEANKGNRPNTYRNVIPTSTSINFARTEPVRATCTTIGGYAQLGMNERGSRTPTSRSKLRFTSRDFFAGWQTDIRIGNVGVAALSATLTVNHNLNESALLGTKYPSAPPTSAGERDLILTIELQADDINSFADIYECNDPIEDVSVILTNMACGNYPHQLIWEFPLMEITEDPDFAVDDFDIIGQTLSLRAIGEEGFSYEARVRCSYSEWYPVQIYNS